MQIKVTVNGSAQSHDVEPRTLLVHYIRDTVGLTGTNVGCDTTSCGACTVHLDGESGTIGSTPAIQSAVADALSHLGVRHVEMPATPETVWATIRAAQGGSALDGGAAVSPGGA